MTSLWDWKLALDSVPTLLDGLYYTVLATFFGSILAILLGLFWAVLRLARIPIISPIAIFLVNFLRGTPALIQLYFIFYVLPHYGLTLSILATGVLALGVSFSGYTSEVFRGSIESIPTGQWEACLATGLPLNYVWRRVVMPQAMRVALPMLGSYVIYMFKESAILSTIGLSELLNKGMGIGFLYFRFTEPLIMVACCYFVISYAAARAVRVLENRMHA